MKRKTSMWKLLIWAYRNQMVQYETDCFEDGSGVIEGTLHGGGFPDWMHKGRGHPTTATSDAHAVHALVRSLGSRKSWLLIESGAQGQPPNWKPEIPERRVVPVWKGPKGRIERVDGELQAFGQLRHIWSKSRNKIGCLIAYEGVPEDEAQRIHQRAQRTYSDWWEALSLATSIITGDVGLTRWLVTEIGAPQYPWCAKDLTKNENRKILRQQCDMA